MRLRLPPSSMASAAVASAFAPCVTGLQLQPAKYPFKSGTDGVDDYKTFKAITLELLALERHIDQGGCAQSFAASPSAIAHSVAWALRARLAAVADAL